MAASLCRDLILLDRGRVLAAGPVDSMLSPTLIRQLYDVDVDITTHPRTGHLTVVPVARARQERARAARGEGPRKRTDPPRLNNDYRETDRDDVVRVWRGRHPCVPGRAADGVHVHQPAPRLRHVDSVCRQPGRADLLRGAAAARARGRDGGIVAGGIGRGVSGAAAEPARHAVHAGRVGGRRAGRDAGADAESAVGHRRLLRRADRQLRRRARRRRHRLRAGAREAPADLDQRAAARRRHAELVLFGADSVRAVPGRLHADVPHGPLADGRPRREQLRAAHRRAAADRRCRSRRSRCCRNR